MSWRSYQKHHWKPIIRGLGLLCSTGARGPFLCAAHGMLLEANRILLETNSILLKAKVNSFCDNPVHSIQYKYDVSACQYISYNLFSKPYL